MADTLLIRRQDIVNLYRVANNTARQLEQLLVRFDLTDDTQERIDAIQIQIRQK